MTDPFVAKGVPKMKSGRAPLSKFRPWPGNPRLHPEAEIDLLAQVISLRGPDQPIVVDEGWYILKGHGRLKAAQQAGAKEFPFVQRFGLTESEKVAIRIEDNALPLMSAWDKTLLSGQLEQLKADGYDMKLLGFGDAQLVQFMTAEPPPAAFQAFDDGTIETEYCCPKCHFAWSGKPKP